MKTILLLQSNKGRIRGKWHSCLQTKYTVLKSLPHFSARLLTLFFLHTILSIQLNDCLSRFCFLILDCLSVHFVCDWLFQWNNKVSVLKALVSRIIEHDLSGLFHCFYKFHIKCYFLRSTRGRGQGTRQSMTSEIFFFLSRTCILLSFLSRNFSSHLCPKRRSHVEWEYQSPVCLHMQMIKGRLRG